MPLDPRWRSVAQVLPDARVRETNLNPSRHEKKSLLLGWMEECFCANCGKPQGMISRDWAAHVFCVCDDCVAKHGQPPGVTQIPDAVVHGYAS